MSSNSIDIQSEVERPNWHMGFARGPGESANPELWKGLQGLWAPSLGATGNTLHDVSGKANNGTLTNGPTWVKEGLLLDGVDSTVSVSSTAIWPNWTDFSMLSEFSYNSTNDNNASPLAYYVDASSSWGIQVFLGNATASVSFTIKRANVKYNVYADLALTRDVYYVIGCVFSGGNTAKLYINGQEITTAGPAYSIVSPVGLRFGFGNSGYFGGTIKQNIVWDRALSPSEISELYRDPYALIRRPTKTYLYYTAPVVGGGSPWYNNLQELIA